LALILHPFFAFILHLPSFRANKNSFGPRAMSLMRTSSIQPTNRSQSAGWPARLAVPRRGLCGIMSRRGDAVLLSVNQQWSRTMMQTMLAVIHDGKIEPSEPVELPEGARVLVTFLPDEETEFWLQASETSLSAIWDNAEDDGYAKLLET